MPRGRHLKLIRIFTPPENYSMQDPGTYYEQRLKALKEQKSQVSRKLLGYSLSRLAVFVLFIAMIYFRFGDWLLIVLSGIVSLCLFVFLVLRFNRLQYQNNKLKALIRLNEMELQVLDGQFDQLYAGTEYEEGEHHFARDIDLFGEGSFFQYANRTGLKEGRDMLARWLLSNHIEQVKLKQFAVQELRDMTEWRQDFTATASLLQADTDPLQLTRWFREYKPFLNSRFRILPVAFSLLSLAFVFGYFMNQISGWGVVLWLFTGLGITGAYLKRINSMSVSASRALSTFQQYHKLIALLESVSFQSELLSKKQEIYRQEQDSVSQLVRKFADILHAFDQRNNMIFGFLGNGFLLWDLYQVYRIECWIQDHGDKVEDWFEALSYFDASVSLGNFAFNHPDYHFPGLSTDKVLIRVKGAGHPLLDRRRLVTNDFQISEKEFQIITGANMAGKSTFLRTVSLLIVMANLGLPVCASEMAYKPLRLVTSMRTADSLSRHESYFFSELKRLKFIVDEIEDEPYFIILDEILKGTNSTDKARGSRKFLDRLLTSTSAGLIATHDLSLCEAADAHEQVSNFYFDATIIEDELHFDYQLKPGICQNMNASFLLKKMRIVD
ncbi:MutS-related protein [Lentiprolixibacter aurantiacus]|uniref:DNA mismatch repair protein MutS n=1 Tax=Lentiprolixibacter aurantiacus TaxID=2993939 RepID=A0AAE3ML08_9FLAO|nr:DNA mismatch repair protein MutS [Lentiprolixibacter aurantiacus]MCX2718972.1 DNA mismatch repair protein MutS [Lentiprolixibacter aurantiacus]